LRSNKMKCKEIKSLMIEDIYDEISPANKKKIEEHLQNCAECMTEYNELKETSDTLKLWKDVKPEAVEMLQIKQEPRKTRRIFYRIAAVAASILLILSIANFRISINNNGVDISFNLLGINSDTDQLAMNILTKGSQIEQLQFMSELINASKEQQKEEMVMLLTDFYQAIEMKRQADLKVITQNIETMHSFSNQRIDETEQTMQDLIQYTGTILDKGNYIKAIDVK